MFLKNKNVFLQNKNFLKFPKKYLFLGKKPVIETTSLASLLKNDRSRSNIKIIDSSLYIDSDTDDKSSINSDYLKESIPQSIFINPFTFENSPKLRLDFSKLEDSIDKGEFDEITKIKHPYPIAGNEEFSAKMKTLDIKKSDSLIIYDKSEEGIYSSARLWFMFKLFGLKNVYVLNGGFKKWKKEKLPIDKNKSTNTNTATNANELLFSYKADESKLINTEEMLKEGYNISKKMSKDIMIDARSSERYNAEVSEPYPVIRKGTMKLSANIYYKDLLNSRGCLKSEEEIKDIFNQQLLDIDSIKNSQGNIIVFSGLGVSACVVNLALDSLSLFNKVKFYYGGWLEMGNVFSANKILSKFKEYEVEQAGPNYLEQYYSSADNKEKERIERKRRLMIKRKEVEEKNKSYLKRKLKNKEKEEGDYSSPEEIF